MALRAALAAALVVACGGPHRNSPAPVAAPAATLGNQPAVDRAELARRADQAMRDDAPLDYQLPFTAHAPARTQATHLLREACEAGDLPSCWKGLAIAPATERFAELVANNCRGGDLLSCRALPADDDAKRRFGDVPGAEGRSRACQDLESEQRCDGAALRRECEAGFPESCKLTAMRRPLPRDGGALVARASELSRQACAQGFAFGCRGPGPDDAWPADLELEAAERRCTFSRDACASLGRVYVARDRLRDARDAFERACQYGSNWVSTCMDLGAAYLDGRYPEPVPGRGQALVNATCQEAQRVQGANERLVERYPACKRATR